MPKINKKIGWLVVAHKELRELWMGGRGSILIILFSLAIGVLTFLLASNAELSLIPPKEMVMLMIKATMAMGLFSGLIIAADSVSGEREKGSLESLLLTPISRRSLIFGKFIAAFSPWLIAYLVSIPYIAVLSPNIKFTMEALLVSGILGTFLVLMILSFGMIVSIRSKSNRGSLSISIITFLFILLPTQLPGITQTGAVGLFIKHLTPTESVIHFTEKILVNNRTIGEMSSFLISPIGFMFFLLILLFVFEAPFLNLFGGRNWKNFRKKRIVGMAAFILLSIGIINFTNTSSVYAQSFSAKSIAQNELSLLVDMDYKITKTGDLTNFTSTLTYSGSQSSLPLITALNIINLGDGMPVDPEDWSPVRTQTIKSMSPGETITQNWEVRSILDGDYLVYLSVIPKPKTTEETSLPVSSSAIHLTVKPYTRLNPGGVLPLVAGMPIFLSLIFGGLYYNRQRNIIK